MSEIEKVDSTDHSETPQDGDVLAEVHRMQIEASWSGPLPPPSALQSYEDVLSGSADRILTMAEKQTDHRIYMESTALKGTFQRSYWGLAAGFVISAIVIGGGIYVISLGHDWAGVSVIGLNLVGLASVFVLGSTSRRAQRHERLENMAGQADMETESQGIEDPQ